MPKILTKLGIAMCNGIMLYCLSKSAPNMIHKNTFLDRLSPPHVNTIKWIKAFHVCHRVQIIGHWDTQGGHSKFNSPFLLLCTKGGLRYRFLLAGELGRCLSLPAQCQNYVLSTEAFLCLVFHCLYIQGLNCLGPL